MKVEKINLYKDRPEVTLTTYLWDNSSKMLKGKPRPAIIINPGDGYFSCSEREGKPMVLRFAAMSYHAFPQEWHVDTDRIAVVGFSAEGHNAALYAISWNKPVITDYFNQPAELFRPAAVVLGYPHTEEITEVLNAAVGYHNFRFYIFPLFI